MSLLKALPLAAILTLSVIVAGCYPGSGSFTADETDIVATVYDTSFTFSNNKTFVLPDTLLEISDPEEDEEPIEIDPATQEIIISTIKQNMQDLGYQELDNPSEDNLPDVFVTASVAVTRWVGYARYPWWGWWGWYPWYPPGWGPGWGPVYPCCTTIYTYETGTVLIDMIDVETSEAENLNFPWNGALNGVLSSGTNEARLKARIDQAFSQSPYLRTN